jgi:dihydroneopterin aldolase
MADGRLPIGLGADGIVGIVLYRQSAIRNRQPAITPFMDTIKITDLEVFYQVGVTEEERAKPQRLLLSLEMTHDFTSAISRDNLAETVDYHAIAQRLLRFGDDCHWQLIETLAADLAAMILEDFKPRSVTVEVKKFPIPQAAHVSVRLTRSPR